MVCTPRIMMSLHGGGYSRPIWRPTQDAARKSRMNAGELEMQTELFIDGRWIPADNGKTIAIVNPATEEALAEVAWAGRGEIRRAFDAAARAMPAWAKLTAYDRAKILKKTADLIRERADEIARTMTQEQGKPLAEAKGETLHSADTFEW